MMRLWKTSYAAPPAIGSSAVLSTVAHVVVIAAAVAATANAPQRLKDAIEQRVQFLPPPIACPTAPARRRPCSSSRCLPRGRWAWIPRR